MLSNSDFLKLNSQYTACYSLLKQLFPFHITFSSFPFILPMRFSPTLSLIQSNLTTFPVHFVIQYHCYCWVLNSFHDQCLVFNLYACTMKFNFESFLFDFHALEEITLYLDGFISAAYEFYFSRIALTMKFTISLDDLYVWFILIVVSFNFWLINSLFCCQVVKFLIHDFWLQVDVLIVNFREWEGWSVF